MRLVLYALFSAPDSVVLWSRINIARVNCNVPWTRSATIKPNRMTGFGIEDWTR